MFAKRYSLLAFALILCVPKVYAQNEDFGLSCKAALLMDSATGTVLYENNSHEKMPMASVTKIMTMLIAMENIDSGKMSYDDTVTGSAYAKSMGGSTIFLDEGEQLSVNDILKGIAVASGNDAAVAMAEHIAGSAPAFVEMMNKRAAELGMKDTHFVNCNGLDADGHYSSAYDIALMSRELLKHPGIHKFTTIWLDSLRDGKFTLSNTNKLVRFYDGCTGLKTPTSKQRQADASALLNYGFSTYSVTDAVTKGEKIKDVSVNKGTAAKCPVVCADNVSTLSKKGEKVEIKKIVKLKKNVTAPVSKGEKAGELICMNGKKEVGRTELLYDGDVKKMTVFYAYGLIVDKWLGAY